jgi:hypothetical protein
MELRKSWFPIVLGTFWVLFMALSIVGFANFSAATVQQSPTAQVQREKQHRSAAGRRPSGRAQGPTMHQLAAR